MRLHRCGAFLLILSMGTNASHSMALPVAPQTPQGLLRPESRRPQFLRRTPVGLFTENALAGFPVAAQWRKILVGTPNLVRILRQLKDRPLDTLPLSGDTQKILVGAGINSFQDLFRMSRERLLALEGIDEEEWSNLRAAVKNAVAEFTTGANAPQALHAAVRGGRDIRSARAPKPNKAGWRKFLVYAGQEPSTDAVSRHITSALDGLQIGAAAQMQDERWFIIGGQDAQGRHLALWEDKRLRLDFSSGIAYFEGSEEPQIMESTRKGWVLVLESIRLTLSARNPWKLPGGQRIFLRAGKKATHPASPYYSISFSLGRGANPLYRREANQDDPAIGQIGVDRTKEGIEIEFGVLYFDHLYGDPWQDKDLTGLGFGGQIVAKLSRILPWDQPLYFEHITNLDTHRLLHAALLEFQTRHTLTLDRATESEDVTDLLDAALTAVREAKSETMATALKAAVEQAISQSPYGRIVRRLEYRIAILWDKVESGLISFMASRTDPPSKTRQKTSQSSA